MGMGVIWVLLGAAQHPCCRSFSNGTFLCRRRTNSGTSFLPPTLFPVLLLKQDVAGTSHAPFPVFPSSNSAEEHLAAASERDIPACGSRDTGFLAVAGGNQ